MKRTTIIWLLVLVYVLCGVGLYFGSEKYVENKTNRLLSEAQNNLKNYFAQQDLFIYVGYSGKSVAYEEIQVPKYEDIALSPNNRYKNKGDWDEAWGDIYKAYKLKPRYTSDNSSDSDRQWSGWLFNGLAKVSDDCFRTFQVFPYRVGYRKQAQPWMHNYMPSVQSAIEEAFDFNAKDEKSIYYKYIANGSNESADDLAKVVNDIAKAVENEYFYCFSYEAAESTWGEYKAEHNVYLMSRIWQKYGFPATIYKAKEQYRGEFGYMYNNFFKVYNYIDPASYYEIKYKFTDPRAKDKKAILIWGYAILTVLLLAAIIPLLVVEVLKRKRNNMPLKERLLLECNPTNFMKPYDGAKVAAANELYESIVAIPEDDIEELKAKRKRVTEELGVSFVDPDLIKELISISTPQKYTNPYDPEKVRIANSIYNRLISEDLDVDEIEELQKEINEKLLNENH